MCCNAVRQLKRSESDFDSIPLLFVFIFLPFFLSRGFHSQMLQVRLHDLMITNEFPKL